MSKKNLIIGVLVVNVLIGLFFGLYRREQVPACLNADEVAFGYNAYSILKTGRDEFGHFMPLRFESFKDFKLPVYSYLSVPFIALFGYNDFTTRVLNLVIGILYIPVLYVLAKELWKSEKVALLAAFFGAITPGLYILTRHAHEGPAAPLFIMLAFYLLLLYKRNKRVLFFVLANISILLASFSYHYGRLFLLFFVGYEIVQFFLKEISFKKRVPIILTLAVILFLPFYADAKYGVNRVKNLLFFQNVGFQLRINEYITEHGNRVVHNKLTEAIRDVSFRYLDQISPEFMIMNGDTNWRFGMTNMAPLTPIEFFFMFVGFYFLFKNKEKYRYLVLMLIAISPVSNALTWQGPSIIRAYFIFFPIFLVAAYGLIHFISQFKDLKLRYATLVIIVGIFAFYSFNSWELYLNHYAKRAITVRAWQCGYKELAEYIDRNYDKYDKFYITDRHGQPYIYLLHYLQYDPAKYQANAKMTAPDGYGFGQVERFDKFVFKFNSDLEKTKGSVIVGYPEEIDGLPGDKGRVKKIKIGTEEIFHIYENK